MAMTPEELQASRDAILRAMARGMKRLRLGNGEEVEYMSVADMRRALAQIDAEIAGGAGAFVVQYPRASRGV